MHANSDNGVLIEVGENADAVTSGSNDFDRYDSETSSMRVQNHSISVDTLTKIKAIVKKIERLTNQGVDIEWLYNEDQDVLSLLQVRSLPKSTVNELADEPIVFI